MYKRASRINLTGCCINTCSHDFFKHLFVDVYTPLRSIVQLSVSKQVGSSEYPTLMKSNDICLHLNSQEEEETPSETTGEPEYPESNNNR
jgi:hypothetical protein